MTPIFIYDLLIGGINVSDFHIVVFFNDYYTLIVAFLTKQIQNRYRYRRLPDSLQHPQEMKEEQLNPGIANLEQTGI